MLLARCQGCVQTRQEVNRCRQEYKLEAAGHKKLTGSSENNGACLSHLHAREMYELVLANHYFFYELAAAQLQLLWGIKCRSNLTSCITNSE